MGPVLKEPSLSGKTDALSDNYTLGLRWRDVGVLESRGGGRESVWGEKTEEILGNTSLYLHWATEQQQR